MRRVLQYLHIVNNYILPYIKCSNNILATSTAANSNENRLIPIQEMDSIVDADMAMLDNNRLHFYRVVDGKQTKKSKKVLFYYVGV